jgi:uncharacterized protein with HEPN domain
MLHHASTAMRIASGNSADDMATDELLGPALIRYLEVIGEAASRVSPEGRIRFAEIPWRDVIDFRNRLIHGYDTVDFNVVRQIIDNNLPLLIASIDAILADAN